MRRKLEDHNYCMKWIGTTWFYLSFLYAKSVYTLDFYLMQLDTLQTTYKNLLKTDCLVRVLNFLSYLKKKKIY